MKKIPPELREEMSNDQYYKSCCLSGITECGGKIEWHHNLIFASNQVNEKWCILPLCKKHHDMANDSYVRERLNHVMLNRADDSQILPYCKAIPWIEIKHKLNKIYGLK
jgi:hypothetical protein